MKVTRRFAGRVEAVEKDDMEVELIAYDIPGCFLLSQGFESVVLSDAQIEGLIALLRQYQEASK